MGHQEVVAGACHPDQVLSAQHPPDQRLRVKALSAHLPPDLLHHTHLPGQLTEDIINQTIAVLTEHQVQVPSKGTGNGRLTEQVAVTLQDLMLLMTTEELRK